MYISHTLYDLVSHIFNAKYLDVLDQICVNACHLLIQNHHVSVLFIFFIVSLLHVYYVVLHCIVFAKSYLLSSECMFYH